MKVRAFNINYCVEDEDIVDLVDDNLPEDELEQAFANKIAEIKANLPKELIVEVEDDLDEETLEQEVIDEVTETTYWLIEGLEYEVLK